MKNKLALLTIVALAAFAMGCKGSGNNKLTPDDITQMPQSDANKKRGGIGDACLSTDDCSEGLACRYRTEFDDGGNGVGEIGYCEKIASDLEREANVCNISECEENWHCLAYPRNNNRVNPCEQDYEDCLTSENSEDCRTIASNSLRCEMAKCTDNFECVEHCKNDDHCGDAKTRFDGNASEDANFVCTVATGFCGCNANDDCEDDFQCNLNTGRCECDNADACEDQFGNLIVDGHDTCIDPDDDNINAFCGCTTNENCDTPFEKCVNNQCQPVCFKDLDCPRFHSCQNNQCVNNGCASDRECAAFLGKDVSKVICDEDKVCRVRCETDIQCAGSFENYNSFDVCVDGFCQYAGCGTDEECENMILRENATPRNTLETNNIYKISCEANGNVDSFSRNGPVDNNRCDGCNPPAN